MRYYLIAGEASGDLHGANLMKEILLLDPNAEFRFWGGDAMLDVSDNIVTHYKDVAFMGFLEVIKHLPLILKKIKECKKDIEAFNPDRIVLIDYPGFNMRIAEWAKPKGYEVTFYISPTIWAWKKKRGWKLKKTVDKMIVILPFEKEVYKKYNMEAHYVGHPLLDAIDQFEADLTFKKKYKIETGKVLALLPGSRIQEVEKILPIMGAAIDHMDEEVHLLLACTKHVPRKVYEQALEKVKNRNIQYIIAETYDILNIADAALVSSGTATLETALFKVPQVVCYRTSTISYHIARSLVDLEYMSLVNLILDRPVVAEFLQNDFTLKNLIPELADIMGPKRAKILADYDELINKLGSSGASHRVAEIVLR